VTQNNYENANPKRIKAWLNRIKRTEAGLTENFGWRTDGRRGRVWLATIDASPVDFLLEREWRLKQFELQWKERIPTWATYLRNFYHKCFAMISWIGLRINDSGRSDVKCDSDQFEGTEQIPSCSLWLPLLSGESTAIISLFCCVSHLVSLHPSWSTRSAGNFVCCAAAPESQNGSHVAVLILDTLSRHTYWMSLMLSKTWGKCFGQAATFKYTGLQFQNRFTLNWWWQLYAI
jgi:hypothetical protein